MFLIVAILHHYFAVVSVNALSQVREYLIKFVFQLKLFETIFIASYARASSTGKDCGKNQPGVCRNVKYSVDKIVRDEHYWNTNNQGHKPYVQVKMKNTYTIFN